ncbi:hypothetical protein [Leifsonia sp. Leaf264]|uniref:hypothetical protein n=1 Tax=Leifsonia sp. Leaf264 TaxID=1736314 RepID=UPI000701C909|nr:hypothetical protein [Leifsonia sp. Leaf264]KQO98292.1 hypothetical protein ASF30_09540 [Leifsonia sp. Leaf264]
MNTDQLAQLGLLANEPDRLSVTDLHDQSERTLVYGYTPERDSFHMYLLGGQIHLHIYSHAKVSLFHEAAPKWNPEFLRPNKRAYPQFTDFEFAVLMKRLDWALEFANFEEPNRPGPFYGLVLR